MAEDTSPRIDWSATTYEGNRLRQHEEFLALPFREKIRAIEGLGKVAAWFASRPSQHASENGPESASRDC